jgi:MFS superfamily sulfate permease-like transporter
VVLDALGMADIDYTGSKALRSVIDELEGDHIDFAVARAGRRVCECLNKSGLYERIGADHFFPAVDVAVTTLGSKSPGT